MARNVARSLSTYHAKRDFTATREPRGKKGRARGDSFVVQKHAATRLHYDLRLEKDGVMMSWAVTRGPSLVPGEKRLAVHVEDHPLEYNDFEGVIPQGQYGGGTVIVWDRGTWTPEGDPDKGYRKGSLDFRLEGKKLSGRWHLVRMANRRGERRENWLLIKGNDESARSHGDPDILKEEPASVISGRTIEQVASDADAAIWQSDRSVRANVRNINASRRRAALAASARTRSEDPKRTKARPRTSSGKSPAKRKRNPGATKRTRRTGKGNAADDAASRQVRRARPMPEFIEPVLAKLSEATPLGNQWVHEIKFDGYRIQPQLRDGKARLLTRTGLDWTARFEPVATALEELSPREAILDGEIVVESAEGISDFPALQAALRQGRDDLLVCYLFDLMWLDGRETAREPLAERKARLRSLLQGVDGGPLRISEDFAASGDVMLQHVCRFGFEGIVSKLVEAPYRGGRTGDWIKSKCATRQEFVIGGFTPSTASQNAIGSLLLGYYEGEKLVYAGRVGTGFSTETARDLWRKLNTRRRTSPPFQSMPTSERRKGVIWTDPELVGEIEYRAWTAENILRHAAFKGLRDDKEAKAVVRESAAARPEPQHRAGVRLTHPDRIYWPDAGITKQGLADFYQDAWPWIRPHVIGRPLALVRCPDGIGQHCFFQKHAWSGIDPSIKRMEDPEDGEEVLVIDDLSGLLNLVQSGVLEIHPWGARMDKLDEPDQLIFDLDPGPGVSWVEVIEGARATRQRLEALGLECFVKTTGGKGLHVVVPLIPQASWETAKAFARSIADDMAAKEPRRYVATMAKKLRHGRVFVDFFRNGRGATAVAAYSTRARAGAPVSTPLEWNELSQEIGPTHFTVANIRNRLDHLERDPWHDFDAKRRALPTVSTARRRKR